MLLYLVVAGAGFLLGCWQRREWTKALEAERDGYRDLLAECTQDPDRAINLDSFRSRHRFRRARVSRAHPSRVLSDREMRRLAAEWGLPR